MLVLTLESNNIQLHIKQHQFKTTQKNNYHSITFKISYSLD